MKKSYYITIATLLLALLCILMLRNPASSAHVSATQGNNTQNKHDVKASGDENRTSRISRTPVKVAHASSPFQLTLCTPKETKLLFTLGNLNIEEVNLNGKSYSRLSVNGLDNGGTPGSPALPFARTNLAIPATGYSIKSITISQREIKCPPPLPMSEPTLYGQKEHLHENAELYASNATYPETQLNTYEFKLRGATCLGATLIPMQYDFTRGTLIVSEKVEISLNAEDANVESYSFLDAEYNLRSLQKSLIINSDLLQKSELKPAHILIITPDDWKDAAADFTEWKTSIGYAVTEATYPADTGNTSNSIAEYIRDACLNHDVSYIILCGDLEDMPPAQLPGSKKAYDSPGDKNVASLSDIPYVLLDDDYIPDAFISRIPSHSSSQLAAILSKFIRYEAMESNGRNEQWRSTGLFVGSNSQSPAPYQGKTDSYIINECYETLAETQFISTDSILLYKTKLTTDTIHKATISTFNNGCSLFLYLGHGTSDSFSLTSSKNDSFFNATEALVSSNGTALPFIFAPVCDSGNFAYTKGKALSEALFMTYNINANGAAAAYLSTSQTYWTPPLKATYSITDRITMSYTPERLTTYGGFAFDTSVAGAIFSEDHWKADGAQYAYYFVKQMHLFGDCSMFPRFIPIREFNISSCHKNDNFNVTLTWADDNSPAEGAYITYRAPNEHLRQSAVTDENGSVSFNHVPKLNNLLLTINDVVINPVRMIILPAAVVNVQGSTQILPDEENATNVSADKLPPGFSMSNSGVLSYCPEIAGSFTFNVNYSSDGIEKKCAVGITVIESPVTPRDGTVQDDALLNFIQAIQAHPVPESILENFIHVWLSSTGEITRQTQQDEPEPATEVRAMPTHAAYVTITGPDDMDLLRDSEADIISRSNPILIHATLDCIIKLQEQGLAVSDISLIENTRSGNFVYPTPEELNDKLVSLAAEHTANSCIEYVGQTRSNRDIIALKLTDCPDITNVPQLLICGGIHGNERISSLLAYETAKHLLSDECKELRQKAAFWILPCLNPDGSAFNIRYNSNFVDINRDFPDGVENELGTFYDGNKMRTSGRQRETQAFMRWAASHQFTAALHLHSGDKLVCYPYGNYTGKQSQDRISPDNDKFIMLSNAYADANPQINKVINAADYYKVIGELPDWQYRYLKTLAITVEISKDKEPSRDSEVTDIIANNLTSMDSWSYSCIQNLPIINPTQNQNIVIQPENARFIPRRNNILKIGWEPIEDASASILTVSLFNGIEATVNCPQSKAIKRNANGTYSILTLGNEPTSADFAVIPTEDTTGTANVVVSCQWFSSSVSRNFIWQQAESRKIQAKLVQGWNLIATPIALDISELSPAWHFSNGKYSKIEESPLCSGIWFHSNEQKTISLNGYEPTQQYQNPDVGWQIFSSTSPFELNDSLLFDAITQQYKPQRTVLPFQAVFYLKK